MVVGSGTLRAYSGHTKIVTVINWCPTLARKCHFEGDLGDIQRSHPMDMADKEYMKFDWRRDNSKLEFEIEY